MEDIHHYRGRNLKKYNREWRKNNPGYYSKYYAIPENKFRKACRTKAQKAVRAGKIKKQPCKCGKIEVEMHHEDYNKPFEITWLCKMCHEDLHFEKDQQKKVSK